MVDVTAPVQPAVLARPSTRSADFSKGKIAALFVVLLGITSIPVLLHPWPPISDYINHLARMHVISVINSDPDLARYYEIDWQVIPNLMMDLIVPQFERVMNVYQAGQLYTIMSFALILSATLALHRQLYGRWSALPLIAFPLLYNTVFLVGTMNYVFGIGLALWALVAWVGLRERAALLRLLVSALFIIALFFCHLFSVGVYGLGLLAFELSRLWHEYTQLRRSAIRHGCNSRVARLILRFRALRAAVPARAAAADDESDLGTASDLFLGAPGQAAGTHFRRRGLLPRGRLRPDRGAGVRARLVRSVIGR